MISNTIEILFIVYSNTFLQKKFVSRSSQSYPPQSQIHDGSELGCVQSYPPQTRAHSTPLNKHTFSKADNRYKSYFKKVGLKVPKMYFDKYSKSTQKRILKKKIFEKSLASFKNWRGRG